MVSASRYVENQRDTENRIGTERSGFSPQNRSFTNLIGQWAAMRLFPLIDLLPFGLTEQ